MSFRGSVRPAFESVHPAHFLVGLAVVVAQIALVFAVAIGRFVLPGLSGGLLAPVGSVAVLALTLPLLVALYVPVLEETRTIRGTLRSAGSAVRRWYRPLFVANAASLAVAVCTALAAALAWFLVGTAVRYAMYATGDPGVGFYLRPLLELALAAGVGFAAGALVTRFADLFVVLEGESPRTAWRSSLGLVRRNPVSFLGYAAVVGLLVATPQSLERFLANVESLSAAATGLAVIALVACVTTVLGAAIHVAFFRRMTDASGRSATSRGGGPRLSGSPARVGVVALVLLASVAGAGYVRAADAGAGGADLRSLPDDPDAALAVAADNTAGVSQRRTVSIRNASDPDDAFTTIQRAGVDYEQRRAYVYLEAPDVTIGSYFGEGTIAMYNAGGWRAEAPLLSRQAGNWTVVSVPGFGLTDGDDVLPIPDPHADWTVVDRGPSTTTYRVEGQDAVRNVLESYRGSLSGDVTEESYVTVVVDRDRGVLRSLETRLALGDGYPDRVYRVRFEAVGTAEIERPDAIGSRNAAERLLDVLYY